MKKKTFIAATIISALSISLIAGLQVVDVAKANFIPGYLQVIIDSPTQKSYDTNSVALSITVKCIQDYYANESDRSIRWIGYSLDGNANVSLGSGVFVDGKQAYGSPQAWIFSVYVANTTLTDLTEGQHSLSVYAENKYNPSIGGWNWDNPYIMSANSNESFTIESITQNSSPSNSLTPDTTPPYTPTPPKTPNASSPSPTQQPTIEPSQTPDRPKIGDFAPVIIPASMILLAIIAVGLLVYFSRHKGMKNLEIETG